MRLKATLPKALLGSAFFCLTLSAAHAEGAAPLAYISGQGSNVTVVDLETLAPAGTIAVGGDPRGLAVTPDGHWLLTANQGSSDVSVVDLGTRKEVRRIRVGANVEFMRITPDGSLAFVTYEPSSRGAPDAKGSKGGKGNQGGKDDDDDQVPAEVAVINLQTWKVIGSMKAAPETEGVEFSADQKSLIVTNEGSNSLGVYDLRTLKLVRTVDLSAHGSRPRGIKISPQRDRYLVTMENSEKLIVLDLNLQVVQSVPTAAGPYGLAFDSRTNRVWVAASRASQLQVFDATSWAQLASIPVGKRCWHFSFNPDASKVLLACGRSDAVLVIDTSTYSVVKTLDGPKMPWGVVVYPKADGSLDEARR